MCISFYFIAKYSTDFDWCKQAQGQGKKLVVQQ